MKPLVIFTVVNKWMQRVAAEVQPAQLDVHFLDMRDPDAVAYWLPRADFLVCFALTTDHARLLRRCRLVTHNGVGYDAVDRETLAEMGIPLAITPPMTAEGVVEIRSCSFWHCRSNCPQFNCRLGCRLFTH